MSEREALCEFRDMPYGLHVLPTGHGFFVVLLGRGTEDAAAATEVDASVLQSIADTADELFADRYRNPNVIATRNFLQVCGGEGALDRLLGQVYLPHGVTLWKRHAERQGWSLAEQLLRARQLADGNFA